ncbi:MAG: hypothetical protein LBN99_08380 [Oscillospiraceae bacterium]|jgi:hypothetical protein|nr:hypothetical protein [Oscillospiraceae bacterium]
MTAGYFDRVWRAQGSAGLRTAFNSLARRGRDAALEALRDSENSFPVIFLLAPEAEKLGLDAGLPERAKFAIWLVASKAGDTKRRERYARMISPRGETPEPPRDALKWMIDTGADWDGPQAGRDDYDAAIDLASAHLAARFPDGESLSKIAELIFRRNRRGLYIHDLVWGFFQTADAFALSVIAKYIMSDNQADAELACSLLGLEPPKQRADKSAVFGRFSEWLAENRPYIYLTGEHFNLTSAPHYLSQDSEAKYLKREIHPRTRAPLTPLTEEEQSALEVFRESAVRAGGGEKI